MRPSTHHATSATPLPGDPRPGTRPLADTALGVLDIEILHTDAASVTMRMPAPDPASSTSTLLVLAESLASTGAGIAAGSGHRAFGVQLGCSLVAHPTPGTVTGTARPISQDPDLQVWEIVVVDGTGAPCLTGRCTLAIVATLPGE